jgi:hypothetical protein
MPELVPVMSTFAIAASLMMGLVIAVRCELRCLELQCAAA